MDRLLSILSAQFAIHHHQSLALSPTKDQTTPRYWHGGDWAMESLRAADEPSGRGGEWSDYVNTLAWEYNEATSEESTAESIRDVPKEKSPDFTLLSPFEVPYMAVIYKNDHGRTSQAYKNLLARQKVPPHRENSHVEPGTACGGALLTKNYVLSVCGCMITLLSQMLNVNPPPLPPGLGSQPYYPAYDIYNQELGEVPQLYVDGSVVHFRPSFKYVVETDPGKWSTDASLNCKRQLQDVRRFDKQKRATILNSELVVVPFYPGIKPAVRKSFAPWPPNPLSNVNDPRYREIVYMMSIGMRQTKVHNTRYTLVTAVGVEMKHCNCRSQKCNSSQLEFGSRSTCFNASRDYTLSGGVIGWPVVWRNRLIGLTGSSRDSRDSTIRVSLLHSGIQTSIGRFLRLLTDQKPPASVFRESDLPTEFLLYDYYAYSNSVINKLGPKSFSNIIAPSASVHYFTILAWVSSFSA